MTVTNTPWVEQPAQDFGQGQMFLNFSGPGVPAGETISMVLEGRPSVVTDADGAAVVNRDSTTELLIGGGALLLAAVGGVFLWRYWQGRQDDEQAAWADEVAAGVVAPTAADDLLRAIAALDDAHEAGQLEDAAYQAQRADLKGQLAAMWYKGG